MLLRYRAGQTAISQAQYLSIPDQIHVDSSIMLFAVVQLCFAGIWKRTGVAEKLNNWGLVDVG